MEPKVEYTVPAFTQPFEGSRLYKQCAGPTLAALAVDVGTPEQRDAMSRAELSEALMSLASRVAVATHRQPQLPEEVAAMERLPEELRTPEQLGTLAAEVSPDDAYIAYHLDHIRGRHPIEAAHNIPERFVAQYLSDAELLCVPLCAFVDEDAKGDILMNELEILGETKSVGAWLGHLLSLDEYCAAALALAHTVLLACRRRQLGRSNQLIQTLTAKQKAAKDEREKATIETTLIMERQKVATERPFITVGGVAFNGLHIIGRLHQIRELKRLRFGDTVPVSLFPTHPTEATEPADLRSAFRIDMLRDISRECMHYETLHVAMPRKTTDGKVEIGPVVALTERSAICELLEAGSERHVQQLWLYLSANLEADGHATAEVRGETVTPLWCVANACEADPLAKPSWELLSRLLRDDFALQHGLPKESAGKDPRFELPTVAINGVKLTPRTVRQISETRFRTPEQFQEFMAKVEYVQSEHAAGLRREALLKSGKKFALIAAGTAAVGATAVIALKVFKTKV